MKPYVKWREPDNGIWEKRDERRHYGVFEVMAWYVLDATAEAA